MVTGYAHHIVAKKQRQREASSKTAQLPTSNQALTFSDATKL